MFTIVLCLILSAVVSVKSDCGIISKKEWDALVPTQVEYLPRPVELLIIQHTATSSCYSDEACVQLVRNIQSNMMENLNYWDIGMNFLVGGNGKVYEGAGWLHVGAHTLGYNRKSIAISFIGNFEHDEPSPSAIQAAKDLIKCGVKQGHIKSEYKLVAHRQLIATLSPGRKLYNVIRQWPDWLRDASGVKTKQ